MINMMTVKAYQHCLDASNSGKVCIVDVGAQYVRSSNVFKKARTPTFEDFWNKLMAGYGP